MHAVTPLVLGDTALHAVTFFLITEELSLAVPVFEYLHQLRLGPGALARRPFIEPDGSNSS